MNFLYVSGLLFSLCCLLYMDYKYRLAFFVDSKRTVFVIIISVLFFLLWDGVGIARGVFFVGENSVTTGIHLAPELPLEEPIFLTLLCYSTLLLWQIGGRIWNTHS